MKLLTLIATTLLFSCGSAQEEKKQETKESTAETKQIDSIVHDETRPIGFSTVGVADFEKQMQSTCTILDVRTPEEVAEGIIPNSIVININDADFAEKIKTLDSTKPVCVYCRSGGRSAKASEMLAANFYTVYNLDGGIIAWKEAGKTIVKK